MPVLAVAVIAEHDHLICQIIMNHYTIGLNSKLFNGF